MAARAVVCLALCLTVCQVGGSHISARMNKTIQSLLQHYKIPPKERFNGKPVFSRELLTGKMEAKKVFMSGVLDTYEKLIEEMLKTQPTPSPETAGVNKSPAVTPAAATGTANEAAMGAGEDISTGLKFILRRVQELRKHRFQEQEKVLKGLQSLKHIQMDDRVVQSKALWELTWLYEEASSLTDNAAMLRRRRRRRQAKRVKTQPRA